MAVDAETEDAFGHRKPGAPARDELIVRVYADSTPSDFTLYEDDGLTVRYDDPGRPSYNHRITPITQSMAGSATATVRIDPSGNTVTAAEGQPRPRQDPPADRES